MGEAVGYLSFLSQKPPYNTATTASDSIRIEKKSSHLGKVEMGSDQNKNFDDVACLNDASTSCIPAVNLEENVEFQVEGISFLPELIESVKKAALMNAEEIKDQVQEKVDSVVHDQTKEEVNQNETRGIGRSWGFGDGF